MQKTELNAMICSSGFVVYSSCFRSCEHLGQVLSASDEMRTATGVCCGVVHTMQSSPWTGMHIQAGIAQPICVPVYGNDVYYTISNTCQCLCLIWHE